MGFVGHRQVGVGIGRGLLLVLVKVSVAGAVADDSVPGPFGTILDMSQPSPYIGGG